MPKKTARLSSGKNSGKTDSEPGKKNGESFESKDLNKSGELNTSKCRNIRSKQNASPKNSPGPVKAKAFVSPKSANKRKVRGATPQAAAAVSFEEDDSVVYMETSPMRKEFLSDEGENMSGSQGQNSGVPRNKDEANISNSQPRSSPGNETHRAKEEGAYSAVSTPNRDTAQEVGDEDFSSPQSLSSSSSEGSSPSADMSLSDSSVDENRGAGNKKLAKKRKRKVTKKEKKRKPKTQKLSEERIVNRAVTRLERMMSHEKFERRSRSRSRRPNKG